MLYQRDMATREENECTLQQTESSEPSILRFITKRVRQTESEFNSMSHLIYVWTQMLHSHHITFLTC